VPQDRQRAVELCGQAALQFHVRAMTFIAYCRFYGIVMPKDIKSAILLYRYAAAKGYAAAQYSLGNFYLAGKVLRKNIRLALKWLNRAADQGEAIALEKLGDLYSYGKHVVEDEEKACGYYRRAAQLGSPAGQYMYGNFVMKGVAAERDPVVALELLDQAALQGYGPALKMQKRLEQFVRFDPADSKPLPLPLDHPIPVRLRTALTAESIGGPCFRALARDLYDYARENPDHQEAAIRDAATLLLAAAEGGGPAATVVP
jgi:uncharacterized protein